MQFNLSIRSFSLLFNIFIYFFLLAKMTATDCICFNSLLSTLTGEHLADAYKRDQTPPERAAHRGTLEEGGGGLSHQTNE